MQLLPLFILPGYRKKVFEDNLKIWILTANVQWHSDKVIGGKTPQLLIITEVFGHTASKRRHCTAFKLQSSNQLTKTFNSLLKFILNVEKV